ncbi:Ubiquitin-like modifier-activating enzyme atg7 [Coccomyxa sp. Obi]|nr:Ubiquitin-like modifier-activating enzyme atg7 [Coccomyxa sp. Obi]
MSTPEEVVLKFDQLQSSIDAAFWSELGTLKLEKLRLSEEAQQITGFCSAANHADFPASLLVDGRSFETPAPARQGLHGVPGELRNVNTLERFKALQEQRGGLLQETAGLIWRDICSGAAEADPALLSRFLLISYADLKLFRFYYWFAFPAIKPPQPIMLRSVQPLPQSLGQELSKSVAVCCNEWLSGSPRPLFWLLHIAQDCTVQSLPLSSWQEAAGRGGRVLLAYADHSNLPSNPGWLLRNSLLLAAVRWRVPDLEVACVRLRRGRVDAEASLHLSVGLPHIPEGWGVEGTPAAVGWEPNVRGKTGPRVTDLGPSMDPRRLASAAVDLNLKLMRWRAAPSLDTARLAATKCLLLGAGTLGCAVARVLLGWGVRAITFLDSGRVAFSNPVRQSLYEFADCLDGGKPKAAAAADALRRIFPDVRAAGVQLCIPMPGHPLSEAEVMKAEEDVRQLEKLVDEHDVIFLLMDTRESRWLPTLLGAAKNKLIINAALGFESFLVMRHGAAPEPEEAGAAAPSASTSGSRHARLGCYFCNDVVAPLDSTVDRTLEQQCTVARPGLAGIAGSLAVEMCCGVIQHPQGVRAPAACHDPDASSSAADSALPLGPVPHMIRGQLGGGFAQHCLVGQAFRQCIACSGAVVDQYRKKGWPFILQALQDPHALEDLTGLTELHSSAAALAMMESDEDDVDSGVDSLAVPHEANNAGKENVEDEWLEL